MGVLKFLKGLESKLFSDPTVIKKDSIYYCEDTGNTYLGKEKENADGTITKELLRYSSAVGKTIIENNDIKGEIFNDYINNQANGPYSHTEGTYSSASGYASHAEGHSTTASGYSSHAEGSKTTASSGYSHAEGYSTTASGHFSHAEGEETIASGSNSHAEGYNTTATEYAAHAEGDETVASGVGAHSEGAGTEASGSASHAEGRGSKAIGAQAHAEGNWTIASGENQHVQGQFNIEDAEGKYAHIVGNGISTSRSNAHTLDWEGNAWFAGDIYVKGSGQNDAENIHRLSYDSIEQQNTNSPHKNIKFWVGTQEELEAIEDRQDDCLYFTTGEGEEGGGGNDNPAYEKVENKTNIINENSTNEQYPSAKAVYNAISGFSSMPYTYSTEDLVAGESPLAEGHLYFVYE